jgi:DNA-directed RNA polymerase specialized sigma24 family protein
MKHQSAVDPSMQEALGRVVQSTTSNPTLQDDLLQEALVHVWRIEARRPGQTRSWYLQSCKFHLRHYLNSGRSIDSPKRRAGQLSFSGDLQGHEELLNQIDSGESILGCVSTHDILSLLSRHLLPPEKAVLACLAEGLGTREIGRKLKVSHTSVIQQRRKIAALLTRLDTTMLPTSPWPQNRGAPFISEAKSDNGTKPVNGFGPIHRLHHLPETQ